MVSSRKHVLLRRRGGERGAAIFIVVMVLTIAVGDRVFADARASLAEAASATTAKHPEPLRR